MDNAEVCFTGGGVMSGNQAIGGVSSGGNNGTGAGPDIFMQGSGTLRFDIWPGQTYTIQGGIADETGTVKAGRAMSVEGALGPDGLPTGGGSGVWNLFQTGPGALIVEGDNWLSGMLAISGGALDLSESDTRGGCALTLDSGTLSHRPRASGTGMTLGAVSISGASSLMLNGLTRIQVETLACDANGLNLMLDPAGFTAGVVVPVIASNQPIAPTLKLSVNAGFRCELESYAILATYIQ